MIRGLTPDDLKRDAETHTEDGAVEAARFLTLVIGAGERSLRTRGFR